MLAFYRVNSFSSLIVHLRSGGFAISVLGQTAVKCPQLAHKEYLQHMSSAPQDAPPSSYRALLPNLVQVFRALYPLDQVPLSWIAGGCSGSKPVEHLPCLSLGLSLSAQLTFYSNGRGAVL